jgi:lysozyme
MITDTLLNLVKQFEGCKLTAYQDMVGVWTIGFGHTGDDVVEGLTWTQDQADETLKKQLEEFQNEVKSAVKYPINQNQFDALTDFAYNLGTSSLKRSTLLKCINSGNLSDAPKAFLPWDMAGGKVVPGLTRRRQAEADLFNT